MLPLLRSSGTASLPEEVAFPVVWKNVPLGIQNLIAYVSGCRTCSRLADIPYINAQLL